MIQQPIETIEQALLPGIFMRVLTYGDHTMLCEFRLTKGAIIPLHQHPQEQTGYLISGSLRLISPDGEAIVTPGSSWNFKGGVEHRAEILEDSVALEVFSPVREDYLPYFQD